MKKYRNVTTYVDGIKFDSKAEANRYAELKLLLDAGQIENLICHPRFLLQPKFKRGEKTIPAITYTADFQYSEVDENGFFDLVVEDVKGGHVTKTTAFQIRMRLFLFKFRHIDFRIIS